MRQAMSEGRIMCQQQRKVQGAVSFWQSPGRISDLLGLAFMPKIKIE